MIEGDPLGIAGAIIAEKYRIERLVGRGGFAAVYRAIHVIWDKPVAIKFFTGLSAAPIHKRTELHSAFVREGALLTELSSHTAGIVQARDVGTFVAPNGQWLPFMVLEWLDGVALDELLNREQSAGLSPWSMASACALLGQVALALDVAHQRGIAHRDIKPANIFIIGEDARAGRAGIKILDFGVAKMMVDNTALSAALARTGTAATSFTPQYGAPEQFSRSYGATGPWTDVFALALVAVELLTFRAPLEGNDFVELAFASSNLGRRPTPRALGAEVSDDVERVFLKALAVSPQDRYARSGEFLQALGAASGSPVEAARFSPVVAVDARRAATTEIMVSRPSPRLVSEVPEPVSAAAVPVMTPMRLRVAWAVGFLGLATAAFIFLSGKGAPAPSARGALPAGTFAAAAVPPIALAPSAAPPIETCPARMAKIGAGQYFQGSDAKDALENQRPAHQVVLSAYCIDLYEVSAAEYKACADQGKCKRAGKEVDWPKITPADQKLYSTLCTFGQPDKNDYPINCVTWEMADIYCTSQSKRLPTEAEWEYMARGPDGRIYPWGDEAPTAKHLNACGLECQRWGREHRTTLEPLYREDDGFSTLAPVGRFEAGRSRFGPYDVVGNVWEWVSDWDAAYTPGKKENPTGPERGERKVIRGGGWNGSYPNWLHPAFRYAQDPAAQSHGIGFRCARGF